MRMQKELIAPCGMNCGVCISHIGYTMNGKKRKNPCPGCIPRDKGCVFLKKHCDKLKKRTVDYCFECEDFPCEHLEKLDSSYRKRYDMSMIENLNSIQKNDMEHFLEEQEEKYRCPECGGTICVHDGRCYTCEEKEE